MIIQPSEKLSKIKEYWHPYIVGELNDNYVKLAKGKGELIWHSHEHEDEMFIIIEGTLMMDFRDKTVAVKAGEVLLVPKGVEHRPWTENDTEVSFMLVEPKAIHHTGGIKVEQTVEELEWLD